MSEESKDEDIDQNLKNTGNVNGNNEDSKLESMSEELGNEGLAPLADVKSENNSEEMNEPSLKKKLKK